MYSKSSLIQAAAIAKRSILTKNQEEDWDQPRGGDSTAQDREKVLDRRDKNKSGSVRERA